MYLLGLDVETTGLNAKLDRIIEVGAVLWHVEEKKPVCIFSELITLEADQQIPEEITKLTGISNADITQFGKAESEVMQKLIPLMQKADYLVAHNAPFDRSFMELALKRLSPATAVESALAKKWIDSITDVPYPEHMGTRKLTYLAAEHNLLNYFSHRAIFDVLVMMEIVARYDIDKIIELAESPNITIRARVSYEQREKAKSCRFQWDKDNRQWIKNIKELHFNQEKSNYDFPVDVL